MIKIELQFTTIAEAVAFLSAGHAATGSTPVVTEKPDTQQAAKIVKAEKPKAVVADPTPATTPEKPAATQPTAAAVVADVPATKETVSEPIFSEADGYSKDPTYAKEVSPKIAQTVKLGLPQRDAVVKLLAKYGVSRGNFVPHAKWPQFTADLDAIAATAV